MRGAGFQFTDEIGQFVKTAETGAHGTAARMRFDELLFGRQFKAAVERLANEVLHLFNLRLGGIDVDLEEITLAGGIDAHGHGVISEGTFQHGFGQVNQGQSSKEIGSLDEMKWLRIG